MSTVHPELAQYGILLSNALDEVNKKMSDDFWKIFGPVSVEVRTDDGLSMRFYEEGIEFYPEEDKA